MDARSYFETVAPRWDEVRANFFSERVRDKAVAAAGLARGGLAADVGAGTGFLTEALLATGIRVVAIDESPAMLRELARKFAGSAVETRIAEGPTLPLSDASVDGAFANMVLHHVEDPRAAIREMARVVRPGGVVVVTDLDAHDFEFLRTEHHDRWMGFRREEVRRWLEEAGLREAVMMDADEKCCATSGCGTEEASVGIWLARATK